METCDLQKIVIPTIFSRIKIIPSHPGGNVYYTSLFFNGVGKAKPTENGILADYLFKLQSIIQAPKYCDATNDPFQSLVWVDGGGL